MSESIDFTNHEIFINKCKHKLIDKNMTEVDLANSISYSYETIRKFFSNSKVRPPSTRLYKIISKALEIEV